MSVPAPQEPLIELSGYCFTYRAQTEPTLREIDLVIRRGEKVAIVGPSGCGKSTLVSAINGLVPHRYAGSSTGSIRVGGQDPAQVPLVETARRVGTVLQDSDSQFVGLTVAEDIAFSLENQQVPHAQMPQRVRAAARAAGIEGRLADSPHELSGGQKQRVAIAGVLVDDVEVLLFDEPLANLDPASGRAAVELIDELHAEHGKTVVIVEHRIEDVLHRGVDRIVLMDAGRIVIDADPDAVLASGLLEAHGVRPPLHVVALGLAGVPVRAEQRPRDVGTMRLDPAQVEAMRAWAEAEAETASEPTSAVSPSAPVGLADRPAPDRPAPDGPAPDRPAPAPVPVRVSGPALELEDVACELRSSPTRSARILDSISARVGRGEMVGVLGSNGAGKSTLARVICGFESASGGAVRIGGADAAGWSLAERGRRVGFVLQEPGQMLSRPLISEEIALGLRARGLGQEEITQRTARVLEVCGLRPFRSWPVSALSHGQKKRVSIACVLALEPDVLILDEPTAGQDFAHYSEIMDFLERVNALGTTVLLITHDMHLALEHTRRVLVMSGGRLIADDDPAAVLTDPQLAARADLVTTGLFTLAQRCGIADPRALVRRFVAVDRAARAANATDAAGAPDAASAPDAAGSEAAS